VRVGLTLTPTLQVVPSLEPQGADLLAQMLRYEPSRRVTAKAALQHPYFADIQQLLTQHIPLM
jgi:serine/threonine protein kinase